MPLMQSNPHKLNPCESQCYAGLQLFWEGGKITLVLRSSLPAISTPSLHTAIAVPQQTIPTPHRHNCALTPQCHYRETPTPPPCNLPSPYDLCWPHDTSVRQQLYCHPVPRNTSTTPPCDLVWFCSLCLYYGEIFIQNSNNSVIYFFINCFSTKTTCVFSGATKKSLNFFSVVKDD